MRLAEPVWLILLAFVPVPWLLSRLRPRLAWPTLHGFSRGLLRARIVGWVPLLLRGGFIGCLAVALARPQDVAGQIHIAARGVAIVVALDHSSSMKTLDFPSAHGPEARLDSAKETLSRFIAGRPDDLIGLVVFANYPDLASPLTLDHEFLLDSVRAVRPAQAGDDGTNLGDAMIWSLDSLKDAATTKKVLILLTDGRNSPAVPLPTDPLDAVTISRGLGVTVHTIAVGSTKNLARPVEPITRLKMPTEIEGPDVELLETLARTGGGRAFVAADSTAMNRIFDTIDRLEKSPVRGSVRTRYRERYTYFALAALGFLIVERVLSWTRFRRLP
jgi:Ca-activated chloride channel family protein